MESLSSPQFYDILDHLHATKVINVFTDVCVYSSRGYGNELTDLPQASYQKTSSVLALVSCLESPIEFQER